MRVLFIGGPVDGSWEDLPDDFQECVIQEDFLRTVKYERHRFLEQGCVFNIFVAAGTGPVMQTLLDNYRPVKVR